MFPARARLSCSRRSFFLFSLSSCYDSEESFSMGVENPLSSMSWSSSFCFPGVNRSYLSNFCISRDYLLFIESYWFSCFILSCEFAHFSLFSLISLLWSTCGLLTRLLNFKSLCSPSGVIACPVKDYFCLSSIFYRRFIIVCYSPIFLKSKKLVVFIFFISDKRLAFFRSVYLFFSCAIYSWLDGSYYYSFGTCLFSGILLILKLLNRLL